MPINTTKGLTHDVIQADINTLNALASLTGFNSPNAGLALASVNATLAQRAEKEKAHYMAQAAEKNARDAHVAAQWTVHNLAIQLRAAVIAQWGPDSEQYQTIGGKKKSERQYRNGHSAPRPAIQLAS